MGAVNITLASGRLGGTLQTNDGVCGLVLTGVSVDSGLQVNTPVLLTSMAGLEAQGLTSSNNPFAYKEISDFFTEAGNGAALYFMMTAATVQVDTICDNATTNGVKKLLDFAHGKIKLLGVMTDDVALVAASTAVAVTSGINDKVATAATKMAVTAQAYFTAQKPFRAIIGGTSYQGTASTPPDLTTGTTNNRTAILIGDSISGKGAALGLLLGRMATIPVERKVSRVRTGAMSNSDAYIGTHDVETVGADTGTLSSKGYITWATYPNVSGYFFSGDDTASATSDDYHSLSRGRVVDKAHILTYTTFVQEVDDEVPVNEDGTLDSGFCKWLSQQIVNQINNTMTVNKEISSVSCTIDPTQNILSTEVLNVVLDIVPVGYATTISVQIGFDNPAL